MRKTRERTIKITGAHPARKRVYLELEPELVARLDVYCEQVRRTRNAGAGYLLHRALTLFEQEQNA